MQRRDGFETDLRLMLAESEMEVRWRRDAGGGETVDANEAEARWEIHGGETKARLVTKARRTTEARRRRDGCELEARWKRDGGGTEARWRRDGGETEGGVTARRR